MNARLARLLLALLALLSAPLGCGSDSTPSQGSELITDLSLGKLSPGTLLPGSTLVASGNFGDIEDPFIELDGNLDGKPTTVALPAKLVDSTRVEAEWKGGLYAGMPADEGVFSGTARVIAKGGFDLLAHATPLASVSLTLANDLEPSLYSVEEGVIFVNHHIFVNGAGYLLGGDEGTTVAIVEGCFTPETGGPCTPIAVTEIPVVPEDNAEPERSKGHFPFAPRIAGIQPGTFSGSVRLRNDLQSGSSAESSALNVSFELLPPLITEFSPTRASLAQYVDVRGGGFVGADPLDPVCASGGCLTTVELSGNFTANGGPGPVPVAVSLIPEFVEGNLVRYVLDETDQLGQLTDLRTVTGEFSGTATPIVKYGSDSITGQSKTVTLGIDPVKQVVWVRFLPSYVESLRLFGLRAVDSRIRDRVFEVCRRDYQGINVEFRSEEPQDFAAFARVDIAGPDPNGLGLLGYDNTPGKDVGNKRLYDKIGGVNALTQEDNYPGYGGVFVESLFGFSEHPGSIADKSEVAHPLFDELFDGFRPDVGGKPVSAADLAENVPYLSDGSSCPASARPERIACAVFALGSMIGTTTSHEVAHSLGLADPEGSEFHNPGDAPNRLMDGGAARSFEERSEIGDGPAVFCQGDFDYLRGILPTNQPDFVPARPDCF